MKDLICDHGKCLRICPLCCMYEDGAAEAIIDRAEARDELRQSMTKEDREIIDRLRCCFGLNWFTCKEAEMSLDEAHALAKKGYLDSIRNGPFYFKVKL